MAALNCISSTVLLILALNVLQAVESFNPKQNPANSWVYFGRGLNQREIIDLARPTGEELPSPPSVSAIKITTEKLLETTLESRITTDGPSTTTVIPTTAAPIATKEISNIRNLPETIIEVNETLSSTSESTAAVTTIKPVEEEEKAVTDSPKEVVVTVEASTSESPLRAKIVVIPKEKIVIATTDASEASENVTDFVPVATKEPEVLEVATTASTNSTEESTFSAVKEKASKEESSASSEEEKEKSTAVASIPSLRLVLRRIFKGE